MPRGQLALFTHCCTAATEPTTPDAQQRSGGLNPGGRTPHQQKMAAPAPAVAEGDWESSKENFQPLKAGRKGAALQDCTAELRSKAIEERRRWVAHAAPRGGAVAPVQPGSQSCIASSHPHPARQSVADACAGAPCRGFWEELAAYSGNDTLEVWLRCRQLPACPAGPAATFQPAPAEPSGLAWYCLRF
jgi:hypothetical protein